MQNTELLLKKLTLEEKCALLSGAELDGRPLVLAAQTTQDRLIFDEMHRRLSARFGSSLAVLDTICDATRERQEEAGEIAARAAGGESFAVISDAGMPGVSDPGYRLIQTLKEKGVSFTVLPGPSAVVTALVGSGLPTDAFFFGGFLPVKSGKKNAVLQTAVEASHTSIFYESPHRIVKTVQALAALDPDMWTDLMGLNAPALSQVIRLVRDAAASKAPLAKVADKVSGIFVPVVIAAAVVTLAVWLLLGPIITGPIISKRFICVLHSLHAPSALFRNASVIARSHAAPSTAACASSDPHPRAARPACRQARAAKSAPPSARRSH